ncbi:MAG: hypothetical protein JNL13_06135 [Chitinophagaceae bacterium]|nr:hypothetical protein [Chitinophagaceae bacterium]
MSKIILMGISIAALCAACSNNSGEHGDTMTMDTMNIKTVPATDDPIDTMVQGHYRYETTDKEGAAQEKRHP